MTSKFLVDIGADIGVINIYTEVIVQQLHRPYFGAGRGFFEGLDVS